MIGRGLLTKRERAFMYKTTPQAYNMASGQINMDEAVMLWVPFLGKERHPQHHGHIHIDMTGCHIVGL